jgi:hypothetical protein
VQEARRDFGRAGPHYRYAPVKGSLTHILAHHSCARTHSRTRKLCAKLCICMQVARLEELSSLFESRLLLLETTVALFYFEHLSCLGAIAVAIRHGCDLRHRIWDSADSFFSVPHLRQLCANLVCSLAKASGVDSLEDLTVRGFVNRLQTVMDNLISPSAACPAVLRLLSTSLSLALLSPSLAHSLSIPPPPRVFLGDAALLCFKSTLTSDPVG